MGDVVFMQNLSLFSIFSVTLLHFLCTKASFIWLTSFLEKPILDRASISHVRSFLLCKHRKTCQRINELDRKLFAPEPVWYLHKQCCAICYCLSVRNVSVFCPICMRIRQCANKPRKWINMHINKWTNRCNMAFLNTSYH